MGSSPQGQRASTNMKVSSVNLSDILSHSRSDSCLNHSHSDVYFNICVFTKVENKILEWNLPRDSEALSNHHDTVHTTLWDGAAGPGPTVTATRALAWRN